MKKLKSLKKILAILLTLVMISGMLPETSINAFAQGNDESIEGATALDALEEESLCQVELNNDIEEMNLEAESSMGQVHVIVENTTFFEPNDENGAEEYPAWTGTLVDEWVNIDADSTMMSCVVDALEKKGYEQTGAENNYISDINGLGEFDGGFMSGWMGTLNDWFTNEGFGAFTVANGNLTAGDEIRIMYTTAYGDDLGGSWGNNDTSLNDVTFSVGTLDRPFSQAYPEEDEDGIYVSEFKLIVPADAKTVKVTPTANNKNFMVKIFADGNEYKRTEEIPITDGTEICVVCGDSSYPSMNASSAEYDYYFTVEKEADKPVPAELKNLTLSTSRTGKTLFTFDSSKKDFVVSGLTDANANLYVNATQTVPSTITVNYGKNGKKTIKSGTATNITNLIYAGKNKVTITVTPTDEKKYTETVYTLDIDCLPTLSALTATADGTSLVLGPKFSKTTNFYKAEILDITKSVSIIATPKLSTYKVSYNNGNENTVDLADTDKIEIAVTGGDGDNALTNVYTLDLTRNKSYEAVFETTPANAIIKVFNTKNEELKPIDTNKYSAAFDKQTYTYQISCYGYETKTGTINANGGTYKIELEAEKKSDFEEVSSEWSNFRDSDTNMGITDVLLPSDVSDVCVNWTKKLGTGWTAAPSVQIIVDNSLIVMSGKKIYKLDLATGKTLMESDMVAAPNFGYTPPTYGGGLIYCPLANGTIQAFNAKTLESVWVYKDPLKGQSLTPIEYDNGYIYTGFWNSEIKDANFVCISVSDEDPSKNDESKSSIWSYKNMGGFYWAGSVTVGNSVIVGGDDGMRNFNCPSHIRSLDKTTGKVISELDIVGDQRSCIAYDKETGRIYFTTKAGYLYSASVNEETGELTDLKGKNYNAQSTSTPVVYKGRVFIGTGSGISTSGSSGNVVMIDAETLEIINHVGLLGYPQCSMLLTTAYEKTENAIYLYSTYNSNPGGISMVKVDLATNKMELTELYDAKEHPQYCITSLICDKNGTIYYKNDSGYVFAIGVATSSKVIKNINKIGEVSLDSKEDIENARAMYDKLSAEDKSKVTNYDVLVAAEEKIVDLQVKVVVDKIDAIGTVTLDSEAAIKEAREAYDELSEEIKLKVSNAKVLSDAETLYEIVVEAEKQRIAEEEASKKATEEEAAKKAVEEEASSKKDVEEVTEKVALVVERKASGSTRAVIDEKAEDEKKELQKKENEEDKKETDEETSIATTKIADKVVVNNLSASKEKIDATKNIIAEAGIVESDNLLGVFEIHVDGEENSFDEPILVSIPLTDIPDTDKYDGFIVVHIKDDKTVEYLDARVEGDKLCFETTSFSEFAVVGYNGESPLVTLESPSEKNDSNVLVWILIIAGAIIVIASIVVIRVRKKPEL